MALRLASPQAVKMKMSRKYTRFLFVVVTLSVYLVFVYARPQRHVRRDVGVGLEEKIVANQGASQEQVGLDIMARNGALC